jgi:hypothetical protein
MKGYSEDRGRLFKLDYDAASKEFVSRPVAHAFEPQLESNAVQELTELRKRRQPKKAKRQLSELLPGESPDVGEDMGMTEVYAAASQP